MNKFDINKSKEIASKIIKKFEGCKLKAYKCQAGVWTIGYGNTSYLANSQFPEQNTISQEKAEQLLQKDLNIFFNGVFNLTTNIELNEEQVASLTSFAFNLGLVALEKSTLLKTIKKDPNDCNSITKQFLKWVNIKNSNGELVPLAGLVKRRTEEAELYQLGYKEKCAIAFISYGR